MTSHDVFISYSNKDKTTADALCATLESKGLRCWIAPRDILPGADWGESIIAGIEQCRAMVLVFSAGANESPQVKREVERAVGKGIPIVPLRIENVLPSRSMEYFISTQHWLDAVTPPLQKHLGVLADKLKHLLTELRPKQKPTAPAQGPTSGTRGYRVWPWVIGAVFVLALAILLLIRLIDSPTPELKPPAQSPKEAPSVAPPVDLLALIDVKRDRGKGMWAMPREGRLEGRAILKQTTFTLALPWEPPEEYRLKLTATRLNKEEGNLAVGMAAGSGRFNVLFDIIRDGKHVSGVDAYQGKNIATPVNFWLGRVLNPGIPIRLACTVRKGKITVEANDREIFYWTGDPTLLRRDPKHETVALGLHGALKAVFAFENIILEPLGPDPGKSLVPPKED